MKKYLAALAILSASAFSAVAADLSAPAPFSFEGAYAGVDGGAAWAKGNASDGIVGYSDDFDGGVVGGFAGYNAQFDNFVVGVEGNVERNFNENKYDGGVKVGSDVTGAVRGRAGYQIDRALVYGAAGWTATQATVEAPGAGKVSTSLSGYTVGAGVDYALTDNVFARGEYRYNDFGSTNVGGVKIDADQSELKFGVGMKF